jgi:hypothetical protein
MVVQLLQDLKDVQLVNEQLDQMYVVPTRKGPSYVLPIGNRLAVGAPLQVRT